MDGLHAEGAGALDVGQVVVDQHGLVRAKAARPADQVVDRRVGLAAADMARDHIVAETAEEGMLAARRSAQPGIEKAGRVGEQVERRSRPVQALDQIRHLRERVVEHLVEPAVEGFDQRLLARDGRPSGGGSPRPGFRPGPASHAIASWSRWRGNAPFPRDPGSACGRGGGGSSRAARRPCRRPRSRRSKRLILGLFLGPISSLSRGRFQGKFT